ncbi:MAG: AAA family ATPase [Caldilineaceae bacterium]
MSTVNAALPTKPQLILITGIMAAGKSTVAQKLAERLPNSVHLRGDLFRRMIVNGQAEMGLELSPVAREQLQLRYRIAATVANLYLAAGFTVVYQDIILGTDLADVVRFYPHSPLSVIVLCPNPTVVAAREANRHKTGYGAMVVDDLDRVFRAETPRLGFWLDNSQLTVDETVDAILANLDQARVQVKAEA